MKLYKCECEYSVFPFGEHLPICIREKIIQKSDTPPMKNCIEKGCKYYKNKGIKTARKENEI